MDLPHTSDSEALLPDSERGIAPAPPNFPCQEETQGTIAGVHGPNLFSQLPHLDFISFLAVVQSLYVPLLDFEPDVSDSPGKGAGGTHVLSLPKNKGIVFKSVPDESESTAHRMLLTEILVLRHPVLSRSPYIQRLLGITWQTKFHKMEFLRVLPVLVFEKSREGALWDFMIERREKGKRLSFLDRLRFCSNVAEAIRALHEQSK